MRKKSNKLNNNNLIRLCSSSYIIIIIIFIFSFILFYYYNYNILLNNQINEINKLKDIINKLQDNKQDNKRNKQENNEIQLSLFNQERIDIHQKEDKNHNLDYNINDILLLPNNNNLNNLNKNILINEFKKKWQLKSDLYDTCGLIKSIPSAKLRSKPSLSNPCNIAIISSWYPRPCGIATHSSMLVNGLLSVCPKNSRIDVIAVRNMNEKEEDFPSIVKHTFLKTSLEDYYNVSNYINKKRYHSVIIGYEFGLLEDEYFLCMLRKIDTLKTTIITILHTLAENLPYQKQALTQQTVLLSHKIVLMTETMKRTIDMIHRVPYSRVEVIPHGVPVISNKPRQLTNNPILISNGLIHQGKGLEYAISAIPPLLNEYPNLKYYILGTPHPTGQGTKEYYQSLQNQVNKLKLNDIVIFNNTFLDDESLFNMLLSSNIYINSYLDEVASVSGTLIMAMGLGLPCISTPYPFAREMFQDHRGGLLVPFRNSESITQSIRYLLNDKENAELLGKRGQDITMNWNEVAIKYLELIYQMNS